MSQTEERSHRVRVVKDVVKILEDRGMDAVKINGWIAKRLNASPWSADRWRTGKTMPTGERWDAFEEAHAQLKVGLDPHDVKVKKPRKIPRNTHPKKKKTPVVAAKSETKPTQHSAAIQFFMTLVDTMTLTELDEIHRATGEAIVKKARR